MLTDIPAVLQQRPNWVCWKLIVRDGKPTKIPFNAKTGKAAKSDDPSTWTTFEQAVEAVRSHNGNEYSGVGFELGGTNLVGLDFDGAITNKGIIDPYALTILKLLGSPYTEVSPSGTGLHAFIECAVLPEGGRELTKNHQGIGIYHGREAGRYFTMTGELVLGCDVPTIPDMALPYLLIAQNRDKKFKSLWLGDTSLTDGDDSAADFALMRRLARLTQNNPLLMEKFFGFSGLGQREKWRDREDYRQRTIKAAIETERTGKEVAPSAAIEFHTPALPDADGDYVVAPLEGQDDGWFPLGDISLIGGASGTGKLLDIDTLIPTPNGFVKNGDLKTGDTVFGQDGEPYSIIAHPIEEQEGFEVAFSDGTSAVVHAEHLWKTYTAVDRVALTKRTDKFRSARRMKRMSRGKGLRPSIKGGIFVGLNTKPVPVGVVRTTKEILATLYDPQESRRDSLNHSIPVASAVSIHDRSLPLDPYILGVWLGDGTSTASTITAHPDDAPEILSHFVGWSWYQTAYDPQKWQINKLSKSLRKAGVWNNKHVPQEYLWASQDQRVSLLQGLMDTDGHCDKRGMCQFTNSREHISRAVYVLAASLGCVPRWRVKIPKCQTNRACSPAYIVEWTSNLSAFRLKRKAERIPLQIRKTQSWRYITSVRPVGKRSMRCITTANPTGLYLFGENFNTTHNTTWIFEMLHKQKQGWDIHGHKTRKYNFHVLAYDRGKNAFTRTMRRLRLNPSDVPTTPLPLAFGADAVQNIINEIEKMSPFPNIIFLEGLDMLIDDANKKSIVSPFMRQLQEVGAHFHIAMIGSVGAPKTKRGEDYAAKRDKLSGSEAWGRNCETVCVLEFSEDDDGTAPQRSLTVLPRNASAEKFTLQFENGRLVQVQATEEKEPEPQQKQTGRPNLELQKAIQFLEHELQDGTPKTKHELSDKASGLESINPKTLERAADVLQVKKEIYQDTSSRKIPLARQMVASSDARSGFSYV